MNKTILIVLSLFIPPLAVFFHTGIGKHFWINIALTIFGFGILGMIHSIWIIANDVH